MPTSRFVPSILSGGAIAIGVAMLAGCGSSPARTSNSTSPRTSAAGPSTPQPQSTEPAAASTPYQRKHDPAYLLRIPSGTKPCGVLGAAGAIWVSDISDAVVTRLDPATGRVTGHVKTAAGPCGMTSSAHSIWVEDYYSNKVTRIQLPGLATHTYDVGASPFDVAFGAGAAWVTNNGDGSVSRVDATSGKTQSIKVGNGPDGVTFAAGAAWEGDSGDGTVSRIDPTTLKVTTYKSAGAPGWVTSSGDTLWVSDTAGGQMVRINTSTGKIVATIKVGPSPSDGIVYQGSLWVTDKSGWLYRIDPSTNKVSGRFRLPLDYAFIISGYDKRLWIVDYAAPEIAEVDPAKLPPR